MVLVVLLYSSYGWLYYSVDGRHQPPLLPLGGHAGGSSSSAPCAGAPWRAEEPERGLRRQVLELVGYIAGLFYIPFKWRKYTPRLDLEQDRC